VDLNSDVAPLAEGLNAPLGTFDQGQIIIIAYIAEQILPTSGSQLSSEGMLRQCLLLV
jgi:hypothetical protein